MLFHSGFIWKKLSTDVAVTIWEFRAHRRAIEVVRHRLCKQKRGLEIYKSDILQAISCIQNLDLQSITTGINFCHFMHCKCLRNVSEKFPSLSNDARPCEILTFMKLDGYPSEFEGNDYF